jgi:AraC-like DNA-binding protein
MSSGVPDFTPMRFSTDALPERERLPFLREQVGRKFWNIDIEPLSDGPFACEVSLRACPGFRIMACSSSPARKQSTRALVAQGDDSITLPINLAGRMNVTQRGHEVSFGAGDTVVVLHAEPAVMVHSQVDAIGLVVPRTALAPLVTNIEDLAMRIIPHGNEALRLLKSYLRTVLEELALATPELRHLAVTHIHDLLAMAIGASRDGAAIAEQRGVRAARLAAIKSDILDHLGDPDLTIGALAARHKLTPRSIQLLFERDGITFSRYLLEQRLARVHRMLADPRHAGDTISAIVLSAGFGDLSHFNRSFRRHYGLTPSDVRAASSAAPQPK